MLLVDFPRVYVCNMDGADGRKAILTEKKNVRTFSNNGAGLFEMLGSENESWAQMTVVMMRGD